MNTLATGDRIKHKTSSKEYTIISIDSFGDTFLARRDSDGLEVEFSVDHFDRVFDTMTPQLPSGYGMTDWLNDTKLKIKCECGVDALGAGLHSSYCPKVGKE